MLINTTDVLEYSAIAWPNSRLFEGRIAGARRPAPLAQRTPSLPGYEAHSHSPHQATGSRQDVWARIANKADQSYKEYAFRSGSAGPARFSGSQVGAVGSNALSSHNDPFMAPGPESSLGWRSTQRKTSTDVSMPDYASHGTDASRADTDMSINWPRRDFQRHMDEAAIEEIVEALSPSKKGQLLNALSPIRTSSSGVQPPANSPTTEFNRGGSEEATPKEGLSTGIAGNSIQMTSTVQAGSNTSTKTLGSRSMTTRSMRPGANSATEDVYLLQRRRERSSSGSSKRKRSMSPFTHEIKRDLKLSLTSPTLVQNKKRSPLPLDEDTSESESAASVCDTDRKSSTTSKGVSLDI